MVQGELAGTSASSVRGSPGGRSRGGEEGWVLAPGGTCPLPWALGAAAAGSQERLFRGQGTARHSKRPMRPRLGSGTPRCTSPISFHSLLFSWQTARVGGDHITTWGWPSSELSLLRKTSFPQLLLGTAAVLGTLVTGGGQGCQDRQ